MVAFRKYAYGFDLMFNPRFHSDHRTCGRISFIANEICRLCIIIKSQWHMNSVAIFSSLGFLSWVIKHNWRFFDFALRTNIVITISRIHIFRFISNSSGMKNDWWNHYNMRTFLYWLKTDVSLKLYVILWTVRQARNWNFI